jgi:hypothetical protein
MPGSYLRARLERRARAAATARAISIREKPLLPWRRSAVAQSFEPLPHPPPESPPELPPEHPPPSELDESPPHEPLESPSLPLSLPQEHPSLLAAASATPLAKSPAAVPVPVEVLLPLLAGGGLPPPAPPPVEPTGVSQENA